MKASPPIEVTLSGISIDLKKVQKLKASLLIDVTLSGISIVLNEVQPKKARSLIEVTPFPMVTEPKEAQ